jgi:hypothetical protein
VGQPASFLVGLPASFLVGLPASFLVGLYVAILDCGGPHFGSAGFLAD